MAKQATMASTPKRLICKFFLGCEDIMPIFFIHTACTKVCDKRLYAHVKAFRFRMRYLSTSNTNTTWRRPAPSGGPSPKWAVARWAGKGGRAAWPRTSGWPSRPEPRAPQESRASEGKAACELVQILRSVFKMSIQTIST